MNILSLSEVDKLLLKWSWAGSVVAAAEYGLRKGPVLDWELLAFGSVLLLYRLG